MLLCKKCGSKTILATAFVNCFDPDEEPYENGVKEKCGYEDGIAAEVSVGIHWCPKCGDIEDVWIEEPMEKDVREQFRTENERLKKRNKHFVTENELLRASINDHQKAVDEIITEKDLLKTAIEEVIELMDEEPAKERLIKALKRNRL